MTNGMVSLYPKTYRDVGTACNHKNIENVDTKININYEAVIAQKVLLILYRISECINIKTFSLTLCFKIASKN